MSPGLDQVVERLRPRLALGVVVRQRLVLLREPVGVQLLDGGARQTVQRLALSGQQRREGHLLRQRVLEHERHLGEVARLVDQVERLELPQRAVQSGLVAGPVLGDALQQAGGELAADDGGELEGGLRLVREAVEAAEDDLLDRVGHPDVLDRAGQRVGAVGAAERARLHGATSSPPRGRRGCPRPCAVIEPRQRRRQRRDLQDGAGQRGALVRGQLLQGQAA